MGIEIIFYIFVLFVVLTATGGSQKSAGSKFDKNKKFPEDKNKK